MTRWTQADVDRLQTGVTAPKPHKYNAKPTVVDGIKFMSKLEAKRYGELQLLVKAGEISGLELQPRYDIEINGQFVCEVVPDFRYWDIKLQALRVEDTKGIRTPTFVLKKKLLKAVHGIEILEVH